MTEQKNRIELLTIGQACARLSISKSAGAALVRKYDIKVIQESQIVDRINFNQLKKAHKENAGARL